MATQKNGKIAECQMEKSGFVVFVLNASDDYTFSNCMQMECCAPFIAGLPVERT